MEFGKKTVFILCVNLFITLLFFEIKKYYFMWKTNNNFLCKNLFFLCDEPHYPLEISQMELSILACFSEAWRMNALISAFKEIRSLFEYSFCIQNLWGLSHMLKKTGRCGASADVSKWANATESKSAIASS